MHEQLHTLLQHDQPREHREEDQEICRRDILLRGLRAERPDWKWRLAKSRPAPGQGLGGTIGQLKPVQARDTQGESAAHGESEKAQIKVGRHR